MLDEVMWGQTISGDYRIFLPIDSKLGFYPMGVYDRYSREFSGNRPTSIEIEGSKYNMYFSRGQVEIYYLIIRMDNNKQPISEDHILKGVSEFMRIINEDIYNMLIRADAAKFENELLNIVETQRQRST